MTITSPAFGHGTTIPEVYSRDADDRSPPLHFRGVPPEARSLLLILDDPDAPRGTFTHWVVFNIDPRCARFEEASVAPGARVATNDWGEADYGGPRPPDREHRYYFRLYALDQPLDLPGGCSRAEVERAMEGHVVANADLMGRFAPPQTAAQGAGNRHR